MIARYVEAPEEYAGDRPSIFLAGGITGCPDWQADAARMLAGVPVAVLNPRRPHFDISDPTATEKQIRWEYTHLHRAAVVLFWFPAGPSPQPIALYELGAMAATDRRIAVGADPDYVRRADVRIQLELSRPEVVVRSDLAGTVAAAIAALAQASGVQGSGVQGSGVQDPGPRGSGPKGSGPKGSGPKSVSHVGSFFQQVSAAARERKAPKRWAWRS